MDRLSCGPKRPSGGMERVRRRAGSESGRRFVSCEEKTDLIGDGGAYISESCASSEGRVRAEKMCRILSHWVCVVCKEDWRAIRRNEEGEHGGEIYEVLDNVKYRTKKKE